MAQELLQVAHKRLNERNADHPPECHSGCVAHEASIGCGVSVFHADGGQPPGAQGDKDNAECLVDNAAESAEGEGPHDGLGHTNKLVG